MAGALVTEASWKLLPSPEPIRNQKRTGGPSAPTTRLRWRKKRTSSRRQRVPAAKRKFFITILLPPLWGKVGMGGGIQLAPTPHPRPPPQGGRGLCWEPKTGARSV